jgi:hypothetical protein
VDRQIIIFSANEQSLIKTGGLDHYAGNVVRYIEAHFDLGANWSGYDSVRAIWRNKRDVTRYSTVLNSEGVCVVPYEVLTLRGDVCMNLVGSIVENDVLVDRLTTYPICALTVDVPAMVDGSDPASITPSEYEQFVASVRNDANRAEAGAESAEASASSASDSAEQATASAQASEASALRASGYASDAQDSERNASEYAQNAKISAQNAETFAIDAEEAKRKILSMRATAETLAEGSQATASYSDGVLTLGIPRGQTGARGEKGDKGDTGATPNLSIGTVETLEPTESATASITGTAENPVLNLGIPQGKTGEVSYEDLSSLLPKDTASGDIISIPDGQSIIPVESLKVTLEPIQSGSGTPSPSNPRPISGHTEVDTHRTGVNVFDRVWNGATSGWNIATNYILVVPNNTYFISAPSWTSDFVYANAYDADKNLVSESLNLGRNSAFTVPNGVYFIKPKIWYTKDGSDISINYPSTDTDYHAYDGTSYTTDLGQTVYGGTLDVVSGELVVDRATITLDGSQGKSNLSVRTNTMRVFFSYNIFNPRMMPNPTNVIKILADNMPTYAPDYVYTNDVMGVSENKNASNSGMWLSVNNDMLSETTYNGINEWLANNPITVCYELATPIKIQLTPQEIRLLVGDNTIWSDGQVTMVYSADVARWVEKKLNS